MGVLAPTDDVYADAGSVSTTISNATGGNFGEPGGQRHTGRRPASPTRSTITTVSLTATPGVARRRQHRLHGVVDQRGAVASGGGAVERQHHHDRRWVEQRQRRRRRPERQRRLRRRWRASRPRSRAQAVRTFESLVVNPVAATTAITDTIDTHHRVDHRCGKRPTGATAGYTVSLTSAARQRRHRHPRLQRHWPPTAHDFSGVATRHDRERQQWRNLNIATIDDALFEGNERFTVSLVSATGGNFENLSSISGGAGSVSDHAGRERLACPRSPCQPDAVVEGASPSSR